MERRGNMSNNKARVAMVVCNQEFESAIQAMPVWELHLPLWDIAKAERRIV
jgi:hypothetical protein